jgi:hypothetical protein
LKATKAAVIGAGAFAVTAQLERAVARLRRYDFCRGHEH